MKYNINMLTLEEKLRLLTGQDNWRTYGANGKLKELFLSDGPNGLRMIKDNKTVPATAMPNISVVANSWSAEAAQIDGETIADDCIENGADVLLAPGVNIKRTPLCGRNFEYFSEDPLLAGTLGKAYIEGVQSKGIGTSLKHFCANNREYDRLHQTSEVDERALNEIYLRPFEIALQAKPWTVMCSYNPVNGVFASENKKLLKDTLRNRFGFDGLIVSDWCAVHNNYKCVKATLDLEMPYTDKSYDNLKKAYDDGLISDEEINFCVNNLLNLIEKTENNDKKITTTKSQRHANAVTIAEEGIVLLKNDGILPLKSGKIVVNGGLSVNPTVGGGGSALAETEFKQTPLSELLSENLPDAEVEYNSELTMEAASHISDIKSVYRKAYGADAVVICVGYDIFYVTESLDLPGIKLHKTQEDLILRTAEINENVIVLVYAGNAVDMSAWIDKVKAVVYCGFAGEGVNEAVSKILTGNTVPSGKLAETFPLCLEDTFSGNYTGDGYVEWYNDSIFVGYRYYDRENKQVLFPFGYGLSYAAFEYSALKITKLNETEYQVSYDITNTSDYDAKEISQVYIKDVFSTVVRPKKELKGFSKDLIKAHTTKRVTVKLDERAFAYYSTVYDGWHIENGTFEVLVGASSRDIRLLGKIEMNLPDTTQHTDC